MACSYCPDATLDVVDERCTRCGERARVRPNTSALFWPLVLELDALIAGDTDAHRRRRKGPRVYLRDERGRWVDGRRA